MVEGTVFNAATSAGAAGVTVSLLRGTTAFYDTTTDGAGHFRFDNIRETDYSIRYRSPDYWLTAGESDYRPFHVTAGSPVKLEARLMPWSKISGRVVDARRNAVANAQLQLTGSGITINGRTYLRSSWGEGGGGQLSEMPMELSFRGTTDASGKFDVLVMPGTYELSVDPPLDLKPPAPLVWKRTYYPGVTLADSASTITVSPGGEISDIELKLLAVPAHAIRGIVLTPDGKPAPKAAISFGATSNADGTFELPAVAEGEWLLTAEVQTGTVKLRAAEWIEVTKHDLESVALRLAPPFSVPVRVVTDGAKDGPMPGPGPMILARGGHRASSRRDPGRVLGALLSADAKGNFQLRDVYPGLYRFEQQLQSTQAPYYLDAIRVGDADLIMQDVEISSASVITIVYKTDGGWVRGKAENCASGGVLLVPGEPALRGRGFSKSAPCDSTGHYEIAAVRPGNYYVLAFAGNGPVPPIDEALLTGAVRVAVRAAEGASADLKAVTRPVF
jgi:hypothetical protein